MRKLLVFSSVMVDNLSQRKMKAELEVNSLTPIKYLYDLLRIRCNDPDIFLKCESINLEDKFGRLFKLLATIRMYPIMFFAQLRIASIKMKSAWASFYRLENTLNTRIKIQENIVEVWPDIYLVFLNTMCVYGFGTTGLYINGQVTDKGDTYTVLGGTSLAEVEDFPIKYSLQYDQAEIPYVSPR